MMLSMNNNAMPHLVSLQSAHTGLRLPELWRNPHLAQAELTECQDNAHTRKDHFLKIINH